MLTLLLLNILVPLFNVPNILVCPLFALGVFLESYCILSFGLNKFVDFKFENIPIPLN